MVLAVKLERLEEYVRVLRGLLAKEMVEWAEEGGSHQIRFLTPELKLINLEDPIPIHFSAFGPKGRAMTAKLGAGWMCGGNRQGAVRALEAMREAWRGVGREEKDLYSTTFGNGCVLREGEAADSPRAGGTVGHDDFSRSRRERGIGFARLQAAASV